MKNTLKEISHKVQNFFTDGIESIARETKFVQRLSKLSGTIFFQSLVFNSLVKPELTLSSLRQSCLDQGVSISEQGLDERINDKSVEFLKRLFSQAMKRFQTDNPIAIALLKQFSNVYLVDSSQISLPDSMAEQFPGSGGNSAAASLKIQLVFDYLHGHLEQVEFCNGCEPDQGYHGYHALITKGMLLLMDLGYFALDSLKLITEKEAYFLSRFQPQTAVLNLAGERLELTQLLAQQKSGKGEIEVLIGKRSQHQIPTRLILLRLPQEAADRQRQKAKDNARRHGRSVTQAYLKLLDWALFITNIPQSMLHTEHVATLYRLRWQIELVFKMCKSYCALDSIASFRSQRILTELYARLIGLVLTYFLLAPVRLPDGLPQNREISPTKVRLIFQRFARHFALALHQPKRFRSLVADFFKHVQQTGFTQKRRKRPSTLQLLILISACYDWRVDDFDPFPFAFDALTA